MSAHDGLPRTQFGDIVFPSDVTHLSLEQRHHVHEYPHTPGGAPEKLGRGLYRVTVVANFQATFSEYPNLYPAGMQTMRNYAETGLTKNFVHPSVGSFPAFITKWDQVKDAKMRSGEKATIEFLEDQSDSFTVQKVASAFGPTAIAPGAARLAADLAAAQEDLTLDGPTLGLFDALQSAVNSVLAVKDTVDLYGNLYSAKLQQILTLCQQLDGAPPLQDARAWPVIDAMRELQASTIQAYLDLQSKAVPLSTYVVPFTQSLMQIALTLYGDASRSEDLLGLNPGVLDPTSVPVMTVINYYPPPLPDLTALNTSL